MVVNPDDGEVMMDDKLPPGIDLLWGLRERPRRGPKPALSLDRIVTAAIAIADAEGLGPLSMSRLAEELGFTTMSLYRYVASKEELLMLMFCAATSDLPDLQSAAEGWRPGLRRLCWETLRVFRQHPWIVQIPITGPPLDPSSLGWMEYGLRSMAGTGLTEAEKIGVILMLSGLIRNEVRLGSELAQGAKAVADSGTPGPTYGQMLRAVADPHRFPSLYAVIESGALDEDPDYGDEDFAFALERALDGIEALISSRTRES